MKLTLIITTYNWPESLFLVLESIKRQSITPYEVIIADDGSMTPTHELIKKYIKRSNLNIVHSWQEDIGFRAARSRNQAILKSTGEYIVLIDGDTILHCDFVKDHIKHSEEGFFVQGGRALLSKTLTEKALAKKLIEFPSFLRELKNKKNSIHSSILSLIFSNKKNNLHGIRSCNMGFFKKDCLKINGFNNKFEGWGREDSEFIVRMMNNGVNRKNIRFNAIQFHLWHNENPRASLKTNDAILNDAKKRKLTWCEYGISSLGEYES
jgi:glycosyltransferase involved in cell wall biosynthesis